MKGWTSVRPWLGVGSERKQKSSGGGDAYTEYVHKSRQQAKAAEKTMNISQAGLLPSL